MLWVIVWTQRLLSDRRGITAIEYAVLAGGIAIAIAAVCSGAGAFNVSAR
jgi:Flp pilus assembly pilin Flp